MSDLQFNPDTLISRSESLLSNNLGDDVVMMDIERGSYYGLEAVAASIWKMTEEPVSVGTLYEQLVKQYDVSPEQCKKEVNAFLNELLDRDVVKVVSKP